MERYEFLSWFDGIVVSGDEGMIKPDPAIYRLLMSRFDVDASRAVFIDDSERNVEGARQVGMHRSLRARRIAAYWQVRYEEYCCAR